MTPLAHAKKAIKANPAKVTAKEFLAMIAEKPSVFKHWETPLEITEYVDCTHSPITHLSKHLTFSGHNECGNSANFEGCEDLKLATGNFKKIVLFSYSGVEKIEALTVGEPGDDDSAYFDNCPNLKIATGNFQGYVTFRYSGIEKIENLNIQNPNIPGNYANFYACPNLKTLEGWNLSKKINIEPQKLQAETKRRAALKKFQKETQPENLPFL
jgi:hypothetical protein